MKPLVFVMPQGSLSISGGNLYNRELLRALFASGAAERMEVIAFAKRPQRAGTYLIDSLDLGVASQFIRRRAPEQSFVLLAHSLASLDDSLPDGHADLALEQQVLGLFDGYIATGRFMEELLVSRGLGARTILLEPPPSFAVVPNWRHGDSLDSPRVLMVSNLVPGKGVLPLLEALDSDPSIPGILAAEAWRMNIVGRRDMDAGYAQKCERIIAKSDFLSRHVTLVGPVAHQALGEHYRRANLFVSSSRMETFGMALQEARCCGLPIMVVRGGNSEYHLIQNVTGQSFGDPRALAAGLCDLLLDPSRHARYCREAQEVRRQRPPQSLSWSDIGRRLCEALREWNVLS